MKGLGETLLFHRFTNPRPDKSVYFWSWDSYLLFIACVSRAIKAIVTLKPTI